MATKSEIKAFAAILSSERGVEVSEEEALSILEANKEETTSTVTEIIQALEAVGTWMTTDDIMTAIGRSEAQRKSVQSFISKQVKAKLGKRLVHLPKSLAQYVDKDESVYKIVPKKKGEEIANFFQSL